MNTFIFSLFLFVFLTHPLIRIEPFAVRCDYVSSWKIGEVGSKFGIIDNTSVRVFDITVRVETSNGSIKTAFVPELDPNECEIVTLDFLGFPKSWTANGFAILR